MKDYFNVQIQGHKIEFNRVSYSSFDNWYHLKVQMSDVEVSCRMGLNNKGVWKIKTPRAHAFILGIENLCCDEILKNEA